MWRELNARNAFRPERVTSVWNALLAERNILYYTILYYISVPERVASIRNAFRAERVPDVGGVWIS